MITRFFAARREHPLASTTKKKPARPRTRAPEKKPGPPGLAPTYASGRRIARLTKMLLLNPAGEREVKLAELLGVSTKGVERYLAAIAQEFPEELQRTGSGAARVVRLRREQNVNQLGLFPFAAAYFAGQFLNWVHGSRLADDHASALKKLQLRLADHGDMPLDRLSNKFRFFPRAPKDLRLHRATLDALVDALLGEWELELVYTDARGEAKKYPRFQALTLAAYQEAMYLVGQKAGGKHRFMLAVERIQSAKRLAQHFEYPRDYDPDDLRKDSFGMFSGEPMPIELRFAARVAASVESRRWHATQKFRRDGDGNLVLTFRAAGDADLVSWILGYGNTVEVLGPPALRERVAAELAGAARVYAGAP
jgi:predicted DNA-binding transcriptional regulator YafY